MSKQTIVQILRSPEGGIRKHVVDILERLPEQDFTKIFITSMNDADRDLNYLREKYSVEIINLKINDKPEFNDVINVFKIVLSLSSRKNVLLHGHGAKGGVYARICSFFLSCPSIYTPHGGSLHRVFSKLKSLIYDSIERFLILFTDKFIFESEYSANEFKKYVGHCKEKSIVNYNGVSFPDFFKTLQYQPGQKIKMASFGLLRHLKGHDIVIDACKLLDNQGVDFSYVIFGYGEMHESLLKKIKEYNLENKVKIENYSENILMKMCDFDLIIHPSRFESFGYVPVEAMSVKVPVITSFEGGLKEVVTFEGSMIAYKNTPDEYFNYLMDLFNGRIDLFNLTEKAYNHTKEKFSVDVMVKNLINVYKMFNIKK